MLDDIELLQELDEKRARQKLLTPLAAQDYSGSKNDVQPVDAKTYLAAYKGGGKRQKAASFKKTKFKPNKKVVKVKASKSKNPRVSEFKGVDAESFLRVYDRHFGFKKQSIHPVDAQRYLDYYNEKMSQQVLKGILSKKKINKRKPRTKNTSLQRSNTPPPQENEAEYSEEENIEVETLEPEEYPSEEEPSEDPEPLDEE